MSTTDPENPEYTSTRNYTGEDERYQWADLKRWSRQWKSCYTVAHYADPYGCEKENFRTRRTYFYGHNKTVRKAYRIRFGNSNEIGAFVKLTTPYVIVGNEEESESFCRYVQSDLPEISILKTSLAGCRVIGRMCVANKHGLIVPEATYDTELQEIKEHLPDGVEIRKVEERLSALGNVVACNDRVALIHPDLDKESEEIIRDTLQVEVFRHMIGNNPLVGSYCVLSNLGGLVSPEVGNDFLENLSSLLELPLFGGTVNAGNKVVASGLLVNDWIMYAGMKTTSHEFNTIEKAFQCDKYGIGY